MRLLTAIAASFLALALPGVGRAQGFGTVPVAGPIDPARGADPIDVEIVQAGRLLWQGRLNAGIGSAAGMELFAQSPELAMCFNRSAGSIISSNDLDLLALSVHWTDSSFIRDRYAILLERGHVVAIPTAPGTYGHECWEQGHHREELRVSAEVRLPPGERVRVDGGRGFEIFLTRPANANRLEPRQGAQTAPVPFPTDFHVVIERGGEQLWEGTLHQETDAVTAEGGSRTPRAIRCRERTRARHCTDWRRDHWTLTLTAHNAGNVGVEFSAQRDEPTYKVPMDGQLWAREDQRRIRTTPTLALARDQSTLLRVQDYVIRIERR